MSSHNTSPRRSGGPRVSAQFRLAMSYAIFLVAAGAVVLAGIYVVLRTMPNYPLTAANPRDTSSVPSRSEILGALVSVSGWILLGLAVVGFVGGWLLAGWILRPLRQISRAAEIAASGELEHRINLRGRNDEFRQVADSFDAMLAKLSEAFDMQRRFAANASHELRTPLAITTTLLDVARRDPENQNYPELLDRLAATNARAVGLTASLLRLSAAQQVNASMRSLDITDLVHDALADAEGEVQERGIRISTDLQSAGATGDSELLLQAFSNLLINAVRHNREGGEIHIRTFEADSATVLEISNTGEPLAVETVAQLHEPFRRSMVRTRDASSRQGYGLGLALVDRVTELHKGAMTLTPRESGGLTVVVRLPAEDNSGAS